MIDKTTTSVRQSMGDSASLVTSQYFPDTRKDSSLWKRSRHATAERQEHMSSIDPYENRSRKLSLTTSPYFAGSGETGRGAASVVTQRKRQRRILRGVTPDGDSSPPSSPEELPRALRTIKPTLIQERICGDPWKIIVATTLLNKTTGKAAAPAFWELITRWPTPIALAQASAPSLTELLRPLGMQSVRTSRLIRLSNAYIMHPPSLSPQPSPTSGSNAEYMLSTVLTDTARYPPASPRKLPMENHVSYTADEIRIGKPSRTEYRTTQRKSPIAHLPFAGPYAIDSFRIFSSALSGGGAGARVEGQLGRVAQLAESDRPCLEPDGFDETPSWYSPSYLHVRDDDGAEWRKVWPEDKQLRRYLVWRWAIEGIEYDPETSTRRPANWPYLNKLIRTA